MTKPILAEYGNYTDSSNMLNGPGISPGSDPVYTLEKIISNVIGILTIISIIYFVIQIILTGFSMISSQGDAKLLETSKKRLTYNIIGLCIVILAYAIGSLIASLFGMDSIFNLSTSLPLN